MTTITLPGVAEAQRQHLDELGHIYVPDVYDPGIGADVAREVDELFLYIPQRRGNLGEQLRNSEKLLPDDGHPNLLAVVGAIGVLTADVFGRGIWPPQPGTHALLQTIDMNPVVVNGIRDGELYVVSESPVYGKRHKDRSDLKGLVAIATLIGVSQLEFEDGTVYNLEPGGVALLDNERPKFHRGSSAVRRRAIGLANVLNK